MDAGGRVLSDKKEGEGRYQLPKGYNYKGQGIYSALFDLRGKIIEPKCDKKDILFICVILLQQYCSLELF